MSFGAILFGTRFVGDRWQRIRLQLRSAVVNLEYLTVHICGCSYHERRPFNLTTVFATANTQPQITVVYIHTQRHTVKHIHFVCIKFLQFQ